MALTPEQIAKLRGEAGLSPTPPKSGVDASSILAQRRAALGITEPSEPTPAEQNVTNTKEAFRGAVDKIKSSYGEAVDASEDPNMGVMGKIGKQIEGGLGMASGAYQAVQAPISGVVKTVSDAVSDNPTVQKLTNTETGGGILDFINKLKAPLDQVSQSHPEAAKNISDVLNVFLSSLGAVEGVGGIKNAGEAVTNVVKAVPKIPGEIKGMIKGSPEGVATQTMGSDLTKINEMIQPKPTLKQARLAQEQGRLYKGSEGGLFKEGTPDKVSASDQQARSTRTVKKYIDDAAKLDEATLTTEIKNSVEEIGRQLKPELQKVVIDKPIVEKINSSWKKIKTSQVEDAYSVLEPRMLKRMQTDFEGRISKLKDGTLDDIWQARQAYDDSVGPNVRQATEQSSDVLQAQKDIWLENRQIFSDALTDAENGLGETVKQAFSDMRDLYEAKNGLLSKAKIEQTGKPSKAKQIMDSKTGKVIKYGIPGAVTGGAVIKTILD